MIKKYKVFEGYSGGSHTTISENDYTKAKKYKDIINCAFEIEKSFSLVERFYIEFENIIISATLKQSLDWFSGAPHDALLYNNATGQVALARIAQHLKKYHTPLKGKTT